MEIVELHFDRIDSTNGYAKAHGKEFDPNKITCITADEQTAGRGRYQRKWVSPKGVNLYTTFYFRLAPNTLHLVSLSQLMTCSFAKVLSQEGFSPRIKWPNDVQLRGKKVSGILCETVFHPQFVEIVLGIGVNVNMEAEDLAAIDQPATSLRSETGKEWDRKSLLKKLQNQFVADLKRFKKEGFAPFHAEFERLLAFKGETIRCFDGKTIWTGVCQSITQDGQLNLLLPDGRVHTVLSGDIKN